MRPIARNSRFLAVLAAMALCAALFGFAAEARAQGQSLTIDIFGPGQVKANYYLAPPLPRNSGGTLPAVATELNERIRKNLSYLPFLSAVNPGEILGGAVPAGPTAAMIDFKRYSLSRVDLIITSSWAETVPGTPADVELRVYEVFSGQRLVGKGYGDVLTQHIGRVADEFCGELMKLLTGNGDFFASKIAFARDDGTDKNIWQVTPTGDALTQITRLAGKSLSPAWSPDGETLAFTHVGKMSHTLGLLEKGEAKPELIHLKGNSVIGPAFVGNDHLAVTLDFTGQPDIYLLDKDFKPVRELAKSWAIDVSPSFDAKGDKMAFVSSRYGNPHIFALDVASGKVDRITFEGTYNTDPSISPDGRLIAFSRQMPGGHRIFFHDMVTGIERQVSFGPGNDETPAWGPGGYFLVFSSNRTGQYKLYLSTRHGDEPVPLETGSGEAKAPAWAVAGK